MSLERVAIYNWGQHRESLGIPVRTPRPPIEIDDETWRDGMQGTQAIHHPKTEQKANYIKVAAECGYVDHFDVGFPASGPTIRKEMVDLINFATAQKLKLTFSAAGRGAAIDDEESILEVTQKTGVPLRADLFLDVSSMRASIEGWSREEKLKQTMGNIAFLKKEGLPVMFVPERASVTLPQELLEACIMAAEEGVDRIAIADTTSALDPTGTQKLFREIFEKIGKRYPEIKIDFHGHNDLGMATANCIVAAIEGVDGLHATARGIGEKAGNTKLEELLVVLDVKGLRKINGSRIQEFTKMAADILNLPMASHEPIVGQRSTETASGVHASTYEKVRKKEGFPDIYFPFSPKDYGLMPLVRVGPLSGLANVYAVCEKLGIRGITEERALEVLGVAKEEWRLLSDQDVKDIIGRNGELTDK
jgi:2-isopropylmalate synthase